MGILIILLFILLLLFAIGNIVIIENHELYCRIFLRKEWKLYSKLMKDAEQFKFIGEDPEYYRFEGPNDHFAFVRKDTVPAVIINEHDPRPTGSTAVFIINKDTNKCILCGYCDKQSNKLGKVLMDLKASRGE